jgi:diguanylate cyclase (GGDEF)-like protein/PAS domain S-box-containing protein
MSLPSTASDRSTGGVDPPPLQVSAAALQRYEEPVFRVAADGTLTPANPLARDFAQRLTAADLESLRGAARKAAAVDRAVVDMIDVGSAGATQHLQVTLVPLATDGGALLFVRDLTLDNTLRTALVESRRRYKDFLDISADFPWEIGRNRRFVFVPPRGALGYTPEALIACEPSSLVAGDAAIEADMPFLTGRRIENEEFWLKRADGRTACVLVSAMPLTDPEGVWVGARGVCRDVTDMRDRENTLARVRNRERVLTRIVRAFRDEVDPEAMLAVAADALARGLGAEHCQIFRSTPDEVATPGFRLAAQCGSMQSADAAPVLATLSSGAGAAEIVIDGWQALAAPARYRNGANGAVVLWRKIERGAWNDDDRLLIADIANQIGITIEQLTHHEHVLRISRTDALTGLLNRGAFMDGLKRFLSRQDHPPPTTPASVLMYVDLDNFKHVNDTKGHQAGDDVLQKVRAILQQQTRPTDMVARLGGDEFAVWLNNADLAIAERRARGFRDQMAALASYSGSPERPLGMSIGIAVWVPGQESVAQLLARADAAMYEAKRMGKGGYAVAPPPG